MERLQKIIAESGYTSRRKAEELILKGKVFLNGKKVTELGTKATYEDDIVVNGESIKREEKVVYLLNKPKGYISTVSDEKNRKTVVELIDTDARIYPIGRLDADTTGLLLLTNDGELANRLMHPTNHIEKTYIAKLDKVITIDDLMKLKKGVLIDKVVCRPTRAKIRKKDIESNTSVVELTIVEGRNHIVKRVFEKLGYKVIKLNRTTYDYLTLDNLRVGEYRKLTIKEVKKLYNASNEN